MKPVEVLEPVLVVPVPPLPVLGALPVLLLPLPGLGGVLVDVPPVVLVLLVPVLLPLLPLLVLPPPQADSAIDANNQITPAQRIPSPSEHYEHILNFQAGS